MGSRVKLSVPCIECYNLFWTFPKDVENHLKDGSMAVNYLKAPYKWHGELFLKDNMGELLLPVRDMICTYL